MDGKPVIVVATVGFWTNRTAIDEEFFRGRYEMVQANTLEVPAEIAGRVVAIVLGDQEFKDPALFDRFPNLKTITRPGTGYNNIDICAAEERGIVATRAAGLNAGAVSQFALAALLVLSRRIFTMHKAMLGGKWERSQSGKILSDMTIGVVGLGSVGRHLVELLHGVDTGQIVAWNRTKSDQVLGAADGADAALLELPEVMRQSDAVVVALDLKPATRGLVSREMMMIMPRGSLLINISRGAVVDEVALPELLRSGQLGGVALDVYSVEAPLGDPFSQLFLQELIELGNSGANVLLTPHNAGLTPDVARRIAMKAGRNVFGVLCGNLDDVEVVTSAMQTVA